MNIKIEKSFSFMKETEEPKENYDEYKKNVKGYYVKKKFYASKAYGVNE